MTTDGHDSYPRAIRTTLGTGVRHRDSQYLDNRLEQDHRGSKVDMAQCAASSAPDRLGNSVVLTTSFVTFSVPAPELISASPPPPAGSISFAIPPRFSVSCWPLETLALL